MAMRKIGIITDTHANLPALNGALRAIELEGCDTVIHTGDAIGIGPYPFEVLDALLDRPHTHLLMGNHDALFAFGLPDPQPTWMSDEEWEHQQWTHAQLTADMRDDVAAWPYAVDLEIGEVSATFCHYARGKNGEGFASIIQHPSVDDLDRLFGHDADVIFYGHHHPVSDVNGKAHYINPGALGCNTQPYARFCILTVQEDGRWDVELRAAEYDRGQLFRAFEQRQVPARASILRTFFGQSG